MEPTWPINHTGSKEDHKYEFSLNLLTLREMTYISVKEYNFPIIRRDPSFVKGWIYMAYTRLLRLKFKGPPAYVGDS